MIFGPLPLAHLPCPRHWRRSDRSPFALKYTNGTASPVTYYYILNLQGDVLGLINTSGTLVARYTYNAWGELTYSSGSMAEINPLRYRGYYYDTETGFYYLQSRYYDPVTHRFINADSIASTGQGFTGTNMFAYCLNNPVSCRDSSGLVATETTNPNEESEESNEKEEKGLFDRFLDFADMLWKNTEITVAIGGGFYGSHSFQKADFSAGTRQDIVQFGIGDGKFYSESESTTEFTICLFRVFEFGFREQLTYNNAEVTDSEVFNFVNMDKDSISVFGFGAYFIYGGSFDISIRDKLAHDLEDYIKEWIQQ